MSRSGPELAEIVRRYGPAYRGAVGAVLPLEHRRVLAAIEACRTAPLGGHVDACDACGHTAISYNSCRNRHCPKCQASARSRWVQARRTELLPVPYFHVVFTLPAPLADLSLQNKRLLYGLLLSAASRTLLTIAADPKHLGARIGFLSVLHTWGQNLLHHPHLHCIVPGGGLSPDRRRWIACRRLLPACPGPLQALPSTLPRWPRRRLPGRPPPLLRLARLPGRSRRTGPPYSPDPPTPEDSRQTVPSDPETPPPPLRLCPVCHQGPLRRRPLLPAQWDTS
ncbi:MAG: transposase zinc-binding domain-containing protein [Holophagales bacterium]|nr:transposase zinc-binding domain-containing protein [Holophagales bacterium]